MGRLYVVGLVGTPSGRSATRTLVELAVAEIAARCRVDAEVYDLGDAQPDLGEALDRSGAGRRLQSILDAIEAADILVVGTPIRNGAYGGLFKHLVDLIEPEALSGKPVLITATGASYRDTLALEHSLRPLFGFFGATTAPTGVVAASPDFEDDRLAADPIAQRLARAADEVVGFTRKRHTLSEAIALA